MLKRRYEVTITCDVEVRDLTMEWIEAEYAEAEQRRAQLGWPGVEDFAVPLPAPEHVSDMRMLQEALLASPDLLDMWLEDEVASEMGARGLEECEPTVSRMEKTLTPIIESLPARQRHRFRESLAKGTFVEDNDDFFRSFQIEVAGVRILEADG